VKANETTLTAVSGVYTISNITEDQTITVDGVGINTYAVNLPSVVGATVVPAGGSSSPVEHGGFFSFVVNFEDGYESSTIIVKANEVELIPVSDVYTITNIIEIQYVTIDGLALETYTVTLPTVTGATIEPYSGSTSPVEHGSNFSFTVTLDEAYNQSIITVNANSLLIEPISNIYTIFYITENQVITVEGVELNIGIVENEALNIQIFSHQKTITIINKDLVSVKQVEIMDLFGRVVWQGSISHSKTDITLNIAPGLYVVRIIIHEQQQQQQFIEKVILY
jgi:hypothetical protein